MVKFEDVTVNRGHGYNPSTGVFTAPRKGLYHISCSITAFISSDVHYQLNQNNAAHIHGYSNKGGYMSSTINAIVEMKKGDRVFIKHRYTSSSQKNHWESPLNVFWIFYARIKYIAINVVFTPYFK